MNKLQPRYVIILAGGAGTRFWPLSREQQPKQLHCLPHGNITLLEQAVKRAEQVVPASHIFILTSHKLAAGIQQMGLPVKIEHILVEPCKRDTAPAITLGTIVVQQHAQQHYGEDNPSIAILSSDHFIANQHNFQRDIRQCFEVAEQQQHIVVLGIKPHFAATEFGYIHISDDCQNKDYVAVKQFVEKPSLVKAEQFLASGDYMWNAGMFIYTADTFVDCCAQYSPELAEFIQNSKEQELTQILVGFAELTAISIDFALMEKCPQLLLVIATFDWDDIGSWHALAKYLPNRDNSNSSNSDNLYCYQSHSNIVYTTDPLMTISLLHMQDTLVVYTKDVLLVADRKNHNSIKQLVAEMPSHLL